MYHFNHANHDILINVFISKSYKLLLRARNLHHGYLCYLSDSSNLLFQVRTFHQIFVNHTHILKDKHLSVITDCYHS